MTDPRLPQLTSKTDDLDRGIPHQLMDVNVIILANAAAWAVPP